MPRVTIPGGTQAVQGYQQQSSFRDDCKLGALALGQDGSTLQQCVRSSWAGEDTETACPIMFRSLSSPNGAHGQIPSSHPSMGCVHPSGGSLQSVSLRNRFFLFLFGVGIFLALSIYRNSRPTKQGKKKMRPAVRGWSWLRCPASALVLDPIVK